MPSRADGTIRRLSGTVAGWLRSLKEVSLGTAFWLALGVKVALLLVLVQAHPEALVSHDTPSYVEPARSLLESFSFSADGRPEILRTPGYPLFLVPFLALFGDGWVPAVIVAHFLRVRGASW